MADFSVPSRGLPKAAEVELSTPIEPDQSGLRREAASINRIVISRIERRVESREDPTGCRLSGYKPSWSTSQALRIFAFLSESIFPETPMPIRKALESLTECPKNIFIFSVKNPNKGFLKKEG